MSEGPIQESSYFFPAEKINRFMETLSATDAYEDQYYPGTKDRIVVMTHDDGFDDEMFHIEESLGFASTWFLLTGGIERDFPATADFHIHFDKESGTLADQIAAFEKRFGRRPRFNRNHRLLWRANNFDFPLLAMHGIAVDTSLIGTRPYQPVIYGKILPIWELPFCIADRTERFMASYSIPKNHERPFTCGLSPIVVLSHPFAVCQSHDLKSCFHDVIRFAEKYKYRVVSMSTFYDQQLSRYREYPYHPE